MAGKFTIKPALFFALSLPALAAAGEGTSSFQKISFALILLLVAALIAFAFYLISRYMKAQKEIKSRNLSSFLLADPKTRDAIMEARGVKKPEPPDQPQQ